MSIEFERKAVKTKIGYLYFYGKRVTEIIETSTGELLLYGKFPMSEEWAQNIRDLAAEHEAKQGVE